MIWFPFGHSSNVALSREKPDDEDRLSAQVVTYDPQRIVAREHSLWYTHRVYEYKEEL